MSRPGPLIDLLVAPLRRIFVGESLHQADDASLIDGVENLRRLNELLASRGRCHAS